MSQSHVVSARDEVGQVNVSRPHLVILGAGASRATCPQGDKQGKCLPLMADFSITLGLQQLLEDWAIDAHRNFEDVYSELYDKNESEKIQVLQELVKEYFSQLELPSEPTIYDHLVLSLRGQDIIATFNWDPLLMQAYLRNKQIGLSLPQLVFLHGNVSVGCCPKDKTAGLIYFPCSKCGNPYDMVPLLYPITKKNYAEDIFIRDQWSRLKGFFANAFMITIFGYSGPKSDEEALSAMRLAWGDTHQRVMEQTAIITNESESATHQAWKDFINFHHWELHDDFYKSWIANHPRRTGEAWLNQYIDARFIDNNPIPKNADFRDLHKWCEQFKAPEQKK